MMNGLFLETSDGIPFGYVDYYANPYIYGYDRPIYGAAYSDYYLAEAPHLYSYMPSAPMFNSIENAMNTRTFGDMKI